MFQLRPNYSSHALAIFMRRLFDIGAIKIDTKVGFKLKHHETNPDAPLSPLYFNLRLADNKQGPLAFSDVQMMADFMLVYIIHKQLKFDGICGIPRAGDPFAEELQKLMFGNNKQNVPRLTLDKYEGDKVRHIGNVTNTRTLERGSRVLLIDDLITKAGSKFEAIDRLRESGYKVEDCIVFLDRQQGGDRQMNFDKGVKLHSITGLSSVLLFLQGSRLITDDQYNHINAYLSGTA